MSHGFRSAPKPDEGVIDLLESVLQSARQGVVRSVAVLAVNPLNVVETASAGDLSHARVNGLLAGCTRIAHALLQAENAEGNDLGGLK